MVEIISSKWGTLVPIGCVVKKMMGEIKVSEWVKGKMVGYGSFGSVHLAMNKSTGGLFVVKSAHSKNGREALVNEVKILNTLSYYSSSPYIVQCLGTEEEEEDNDNNSLHVFMEYMAGGSLADVAHKFGGSLDEDVVRLYTREILHGLKHLHQHGIVHCDLKCRNVLLGSSGNVKLADFGCAKRVKDLKKKKKKKGMELNSLNGTPLWMAPEVLRRNETSLELDYYYYAADIWSLGCTVIEMATGRPPWDHLHEVVNNPMAAVLWIANNSNVIPQFPTHFSKEGLDFLTKCLEREPNKRSTVDELLTHPFVSTSTKDCAAAPAASSPASVLEVQNFEDSDEELQSPEEGIHFSITSSLSPCCDDPQTWQLEDGASGGGNWVTVRSGSNVEREVCIDHR